MGLADDVSERVTRMFTQTMALNNNSSLLPASTLDDLFSIESNVSNITNHTGTTTPMPPLTTTPVNELTSVNQTESLMNNTSPMENAVTESINATSAIFALNSTETLVENTTFSVREPKFIPLNDTDLEEHVVLLNQTLTNSSTPISLNNNTSTDLPINGTLENLTENNNDPEQFCLPTQFLCPNSSTASGNVHCLDQDKVCDGIVDCPFDQFDELNCEQIQCGENFMCGTITPFDMDKSNVDILGVRSQLLKAVYSANSTALDNSTLATSPIPVLFNNQTNSLLGRNANMCIPRVAYCNGIWDCPDGSDESANCSISKCRANEIMCQDKSACITAKQACDGVYNCRDHSDELGCSKFTVETIGILK